MEEHIYTTATSVVSINEEDSRANWCMTVKEVSEMRVSLVKLEKIAEGMAGCLRANKVVQGEIDEDIIYDYFNEDDDLALSKYEAYISAADVRSK